MNDYYEWNLECGDISKFEDKDLVVLHDYAQRYGLTELTDDQIVQSVMEASAFFNIDCPDEVIESFTTGVCTRISSTPSDDVLLISKKQMEDMGIKTKEAFDLVMTHEGAHRSLQGLGVSYTPQQEELYCDMMAGVRAGLNGVSSEAINAMKESLRDTVESDTHPAGELRIQAIDEGINFAKKYSKEHNFPPTMDDCIGEFNKLHDLVTLRPTNPDNAKQDGTSEYSEEIHRLSKYDDNDYNIKAAQSAIEREDYSNAKKHLDRIHS